MNHMVEIVGGGVLLAWLALMAAYLAWANKRYNINYGLSDHEWKVLCPSLHAKEKEFPRYQKLHEEWAAQTLRRGGAEPALTMPARNPYWKNTFGLPPGTIRGALALTAMVMFLVIEGINIFQSSVVHQFDKPGVEHQFDQLITAFMMVLAFYFGSRAVEMLRPKGNAEQKTLEEEVKPATPTPGEGESEGEEPAPVHG